MKNLTLQRVAAVDVFRALTMFLMLFVNDIPGLKNVPHWLMHAAADEDMLGFSDTIFPAFLFCMGMSVSFAIQNRYKKGDTTTQVIAHIFWRTVALIAMGLFSLNSGGIEGGLSPFLVYYPYGNRFLPDMGSISKGRRYKKSPFHRNESGRRGIACNAGYL